MTRYHGAWGVRSAGSGPPRAARHCAEAEAEGMMVAGAFTPVWWYPVHVEPARTRLKGIIISNKRASQRQRQFQPKC